MLGVGTITIDKTNWQVSIAADPQDLMAGLGGLAGIPAGTGELFDLGSMQTIQVTTAPMLFNLDIATLDDNLKVTEIYRDVPPGYLVTSQSPAQYFLEVNAGELVNVNVGDQASVVVTTIPVIFSGISGGMSWSSVLDIILGIVLMAVFAALVVELVRALVRPKGGQLRLQADNRRLAGGKFFVDTDPMGDIIIRRSGRPNQSVFLQLEADKDAVLDLLKPAERRDLNSGWPIEVKDSEPRASTLQEIWDMAAIPSSPEFLPATSTIPADKRAEIEKKYGRWATNLAMAVCPYGDVKCVEREAKRFYQTRDIRDLGGNYMADARKLDSVKYVTILAAGQTPLTIGSVVTVEELMKENRHARERGENPATAQIWKEGKPVTIRPRTMPDESRIKNDLKKSIGEEWTAHDHYRTRGGTARQLGDQTTADLYDDIGDDEHDHYDKFSRRLEYLADDQEFLAYTIEDIGYRDKIDDAFLAAMRRARGGS